MPAKASWLRSIALALAPLAVGGCSGLPAFDEALGYPGLALDIRNFYERHAWERQATCPTPEMRGILRATILEEREDEMVALVRYTWHDPSRNDDGNDLFAFGGVGCQGIGERRFTFALGGDRPRVVAMTGEQRPPRRSGA